MPDVIVPEDQEVLLRGEVGRQLSVPFEVLAVSMAEEEKSLGVKSVKGTMQGCHA